MKAGRLSTVFLDAGDTLLRTRKPLAGLWAEALFGAHATDEQTDSLGAAMGRLFESTPAWVDGHIRYSDRWFLHFTHLLLRRLDLADGDDRLARRLIDMLDDPGSYRVFPDVAECLTELSRSGLRVAIVSNWGEGLSDVLKGLGIHPDRAAVVTSVQAGAEKPSPGIFRAALAATGSTALETTHVGDSIALDIDAAREAGLGSAVLLDRDGTHRDRDDRIGSLQDLVPCLRRRGLLGDPLKEQ